MPVIIIHIHFHYFHFSLSAYWSTNGISASQHDAQQPPCYAATDYRRSAFRHVNHLTDEIVRPLYYRVSSRPLFSLIHRLEMF